MRRRRRGGVLRGCSIGLAGLCFGMLISPAIAQEPEEENPVPLSGEVDEAPATYRYPMVNLSGDDESSPCLPGNRQCGTGRWWAKTNSLLLRHLVEYDLPGPGLVTELRYAEAVGLLWQWPEGRALLIQAANNRVEVATALEHQIPYVYAHYRPGMERIRFNRAVVEAPTWMVAAVLAHELAHAADEAIRAEMAWSSQRCLAAEQRAFETEARYLGWISERFGRLPATDEVRAALPTSSWALFSSLQTVAESEDLEALTRSLAWNC